MSRDSVPPAERDDFVRRIVPDPASPPNAVVLEGFVGDSDAEGHVRVYGDPSLSSWVDVPADAILHSVRRPERQSPLGGSVLWLDGGATLRPPPATRARVTAAEFLRGPVQADLGAAARAAAGNQAFWTVGCQVPASGPACTLACGAAANRAARETPWTYMCFAAGARETPWTYMCFAGGA
ncbi:MAG TPA: hypothetical protein VGW75_16695 [Solirubrobacteraceae bacterium]|jgi:hypothetical protein|nr:hypothetical protein [Solirubrobacteraceae bacterium]